MSRPTYETTQDRDNERDVVNVACATWPGLVVTPMPRMYPVDYWGERGSYAAAIEIKCRRYAMSELRNMNGFILSLRKWAAADALCRAAGVPFKVWVRTREVNGFGYWSHTTTDWSHDGVGIFGREDRNDPADREPCIRLSFERFTKFERG